MTKAESGISQQTVYRGRFAPSPTGPLHFGSLVAAVASYSQAKAMKGEWLLRIEDIDPPRNVPGAADSIIRTLEKFGFEWDGEIVYQQKRLEFYQSAIEQLQAEGLLYRCQCSRKDIAILSSSGRYPGTCRTLHLPASALASWRILTEQSHIRFEDRIQGPQHVRLFEDIGDFVVKRADGVYSYQLAVAVDDVDQKISEVVRGYDLLDSTSRQLYLQQQLGYTSPVYAHHPIAVNAEGEKLSKQTYATALKTEQVQLQLWRALVFLGQAPPDALQHEPLMNIWSWTMANWSLSKIPGCPSRPDLNEASTGQKTDFGS